MSQISKAFLLKNYKKKKNTLELLNYLTFIFVLVISVSTIQFLSLLRTYAEEVPTEETIKQGLSDKGENSKIYDRNGVHLYTFKDPDRDREYATYKEMPPVVIATILAAEDKDFFIHEGIDYLGTIKGIATTVATNGDTKVGGSTLTQQLVKQALLSNERTVDRKVKEGIITLFVERDYSKEEIIEYYLNISNFGGRVEGIKTASQTYFNKPMDQLTLNEAAFLMALIQSPGDFSPLFATDKEKALELSLARRDEILKQIVDNPRLIAFLNSDGNAKYLKMTSSEGESLDIAAGNPAPKYNAKNISAFKGTTFQFQEHIDILKAPHWVFYVRDILGKEPYNLSVKDLYSGGYEIYTSLDIRVQDVAQKRLKEGVDKYGPTYRFENGALVSIDPRNGEIIAMVGSKGYDLPSDPNNEKFDPQVNVTISDNLLGSSLKPWVAYKGIESGKYSKYTIVDDSPKKYYGFYKPKNSDGKFMGKMTLHKALLDSRNIPFLEMSYKMGDWVLPELMTEVGYKEKNNYGLAAAVGGVNETLLDHTAAYTGFANGGKVMKKKPVLKILDSEGKSVFQAEDVVLKQLDTRSVAVVNSILGDKKYTPLTYWAKFPRGQKVAGKTGTSDLNMDTYYEGYGPKMVTGIWCGNNNNARMTSGSFGSRNALLIWNMVMTSIYDEFPEYREYGSY